MKEEGIAIGQQNVTGCGWARESRRRWPARICRVQRREVVLLGLRCRIPVRMHLLSRRFFFSAPQLQTWATGKRRRYGSAVECALPLNTPHCAPSPPRPSTPSPFLRWWRVRYWVTFMVIRVYKTNVEETFHYLCNVCNTVVDFIKISSYFSYQWDSILFPYNRSL